MGMIQHGHEHNATNPKNIGQHRYNIIYKFNLKLTYKIKVWNYKRESMFQKWAQVIMNTIKYKKLSDYCAI